MLTGLGVACALSSTASAETVVEGEPSGVMSAQLNPGTHPLSFPLIRSEVFAGIVASNHDGSITFASGDVASALSAGEKYYLEVVTGPFEGDRIDLAAASGPVAMVAFGASTHSTVSSLDHNALIGARLVIRRHTTLKAIATQFSPTLVGHNSAAIADQVLVYQNGSLSRYYLRGDGASWREPGKTADQRDLVIPPDASVLVQLKSGPKRWLHHGAVRANGFRVNLTPGIRTFSSGFPMNLSFIDVGGFVDPQLPANVRWVGSDNETADGIQIYNPASNAFDAYYLRADGTSWIRAGDTVDRAGEKKLEARSMLLIKRTNADPDYIIVRPYSL